MKKLLVAGAGLIVGFIAIVVAAVMYYQLSWPPTFPDTPRPQLEASSDAAVIARGEYLFHVAAHCTQCHSPMQEHWDKEVGQRSAPKGGTEIPMGPMGIFRPPNITPDIATGVGAWSDADLARVIVHGIRPDDTPALLMVAAGPMSEQDVVAVLSYMRAMPAVNNVVPASEVGVLGKVLLQSAAKILAAPKPPFAVPPFAPEGELSIARGRYLAEGPAFCISCHSDIDEETLLIPQPFAGGKPEADPWDATMELRAPNLTPDPATGYVGDKSEEVFVARFRAGRTVAHSFMPWDNYRELTETDLRSIYRFLRSLAPIENDTGPVYRPAGWTPEPQ